MSLLQSLDWDQAAVEKELHLSEKKIEQSLLDENRINLLYSIDEYLQQKYGYCLNCLNSIIRELRVGAAKIYDLGEKRKALTLIEKCDSMIENLFDKSQNTISTEIAIESVMRFISEYRFKVGE